MSRSLAVAAALSVLSLACTQEKVSGDHEKVGEKKANQAQTKRAVAAGNEILPFDFRPEPVAARTKVGAPIQLTASDGSGLALVSVEARALLEPPLAFTELTLTFDNPEPRIREGRFSLTLPEGASISRFAMEIGGRWQEGEVVEKQRARRVYEDFLHRRQDPALLEAAAGNQFSARVFPIPANGRKKLIVSYSQELQDDQTPYNLPLLGLPKVTNFEAKVFVQKISAAGGASNLGGQRIAHETVEVSKKNWTPDQDLEVAQPKLHNAGIRQKNLVLVRVKPEVSSEPDAVHGLVVLVDTSASRALGFSSQLKLTRQLLEALAAGAGKDTPVLVGAYDQTTRWLYEGPASGAGDVVKKINSQRALGASNLEGTLASLAAHLGKSDSKYDRLVLVTDGVATAGSTEGDELKAKLSALGRFGLKRADALVVGGLTDEPGLRSLVRGNLARDGVLVADSTAPIEIARRLNQATFSDLEVKVPGAKWVWPMTLDGVQPGDVRLVYADLPEDQPLSLSVAGQEVLTNAKTGNIDAVLLKRAWVKARMARLKNQMNTAAAGDMDLKSALRQQITKLSIENRVLSPYTALLVLETEHDYARYNIARNGLADILTVSDGGLKRLARADIAVAKKQPVPSPRPKGDSRGPGRRRAAAPTEGLGNVGDPALPATAVPAEIAADSGASLQLRGGSADANKTAAPEDGFMDSESDDIQGEMAPARERPASNLRLEESIGTRGSGSGGGGRTTGTAFGRGSLGGEGRGRAVRRRRPAPDSEPPPAPETKKKNNPAWNGRFAKVMLALQADKTKEALQEATAWREEEPGNVLALIALGEAFEGAKDLDQAARAYGSIIDLFPGRADLRRHAAARLERLKTPQALALAVDCYQKSAADRPDHPSAHRGLAMALLAAKRPSEAVDALITGIKQKYPSRFPGVQQILRDDLAIAAAVAIAADSKQKDSILKRLEPHNVKPATEVTTRFILSWETDANDVDFHIHDARGGHAYYQNTNLPSGGSLYADVTRGYGPECFTIKGKMSAAPYRLEAHYYSRGPMGYGMGRLQIAKHDGRGNVSFEERPFVVMNDGAFVPLGDVK